MPSTIRDRLLVTIAFLAATIGLAVGMAGAAEANPTNSGGTISGCTYCHTGRLPPAPTPSTTVAPTTTTQVDPEDEGSDQLRIVGPRF